MIETTERCRDSIFLKLGKHDGTYFVEMLTFELTLCVCDQRRVHGAQVGEEAKTGGSS